MRKIIRPILGIVLLTLIVGAVWWRTRQQTQAAHGLTGSGTIEATQVQIGSEVAGRVVQVRVKEGQTVQAGDVLFSLDDSMVSVQRAQAQAAVNTARAQRNQLLAGARAQQRRCTGRVVVQTHLHRRYPSTGRAYPGRAAGWRVLDQHQTHLELGRGDRCLPLPDSA